MDKGGVGGAKAVGGVLVGRVGGVGGAPFWGASPSGPSIPGETGMLLADASLRPVPC